MDDCERGHSPQLLRQCGLTTTSEKQDSSLDTVAAPQGMTLEDFEAFVDIDAGEECTDTTDKELCQEVREAKGAASIMDESSTDEEEAEELPLHHLQRV
ncbi:Hypp2856 [Branchiostoma lanceolatum]|uniref:Hypp2856 protein n=1 Tax=Branchiostoma lanceolatum TaxID=7740 RepID=A0A8J9ZVE2_BRALA|nr:Hypp2856 [Branchiostoma lanceolatum]